MYITATPNPGVRVRKEDGALLKAEGETVERNSYWLRRQNDGDVTLSVEFESSESKADEPGKSAKPAK